MSKREREREREGESGRKGVRKKIKGEKEIEMGWGRDR